MTLLGWLSFRRLNRFIVIRDSYGSIQATIREEDEQAKVRKNNHQNFDFVFLQNFSAIEISVSRGVPILRKIQTKR